MMKNKNEMKIILDNLEYGDSGEVVHHQYNIIDFVLQYRFQGGPEQPIRYLEMRVNKNDIDNAYEELMNSIVEGRTRLIVDAVDGGTFVVSKIWLNENQYELVAMGIEVTLNTATLSSDVDYMYPPLAVKTIFEDWRDTLNLESYEEGEDIYDDGFEIYFSSSYAEKLADPEFLASNQYPALYFKENMPTLVAINMCALLMNAFVFFAQREFIVNDVPVMRNTLHFVSYDDIDPLAYNPGSPSDGIVNVYPKMNSVDAEYTMFDLMMFEKIIGISSKNSEGSETIINNQIISVDGARAESSNRYSKLMYGDYAGTSVITDLIVASNPVVQQIANNIVRRYKDPTRSITFAMSEAVSSEEGTGWEGSIPVFSYAKKIVDGVNNIVLTNEHLCEPELIDGMPNEDKKDNFMLRLSTFIRYYPEFTTEYTFGVMKETTLSQELANKLTTSSGILSDIRDSSGKSLAVNGIVNVSSLLPYMFPIGADYLSANDPSSLLGFGQWNPMGVITLGSFTSRMWRRVL